MWQRAYLRKLKADIDLWIERGWVTPANAEAILASATQRPTTRRMPVILAILGAVLIGFAAMSFVAANWNEISKLTKLVTVFAALWAAWFAAIALHKRGHEAYAQAAVLVGLGLFGAGIMLIAQIYHIVTDDPGGILAWCIASLATALLLPSRPALALAVLLSVIWSVFALQMDESAPHWGFWIIWAISAFLALRFSWAPGFHLVLIAAFIWQAATAMAGAFNIESGWLLVVFTLEALCIWLAAILFSSRGARFASTAQAYGITLTFALFWFFQNSPDIAAEDGSGFTLFACLLFAALLAVLGAAAVSKRLIEARHLAGIGALAIASVAYPFIEGAAPHLVPWIYAALFLVLSAWLVSWGTANESRFAVNAGFIAFGVEVLWLYFETLNTLLDTAIFFALGGILLIAGAFVMERMRRRLVKQTEGAAS